MSNLHVERKDKKKFGYDFIWVMREKKSFVPVNKDVKQPWKASNNRLSIFKSVKIRKYF